MYTVAVTGITGKSGKAFLNNLIKHCDEFYNYHFIFVCRKKSAEYVSCFLEGQILSAEVIIADLAQPDSIENVFSQPVDMLFHIAGIYLTLNIVPIAVKYGVQDYVLVHTSGIYSKYKSARCEYETIESKVRNILDGKNLTTLRPTMIYGDLEDGNVSTFIRMVDGFPIMPIINGAKYELQPVWGNDLGKAYYQVLRNWDRTQNKEYVLSGKDSSELLEMLRIIAERLHKMFRYFSVPFPIAYSGAVLLWGCSLGRIDYREKVQRMVESRAYSHHEATLDFGYTPKSFSDGLKEELELYIRRKNK